ncbi:MAG TPA: arylesterase [Candidatus Binataceae bacterium]|jgi:acyl-CoA thioesterase-1
MNRVRFKLIGLLLAGLAFALAGQAAAAPLKILAFGTSLTQSFGVPPGMELPAVLQAKLDAAHIQARIVNAGVSGDTSADGLSRIDWSLADHPDAAIVEMGSNDALRGIDPAETEQNIASILEKLNRNHVPVLLLGMKAPRNLGHEYAGAFDAIYPRLAQRYHAILYPFVLDGVALDPKLNQEDGIHPNPAGVKVIAARLFPYVQRLIAEVPRKKDGR